MRLACTRLPRCYVLGLLAAGATIVAVLAWRLVPMLDEIRLVARYRGPQSNWPALDMPDGVRAEPLAALPERPPVPANNPYSDARKTLGKQLFFDRRLSRSDQIACASCHDPGLGWTDGRRTAIGPNRRVGGHNAPSVLNAGFKDRLF